MNNLHKEIQSAKDKEKQRKALLIRFKAHLITMADYMKELDKIG